MKHFHQYIYWKFCIKTEGLKFSGFYIYAPSFSPRAFLSSHLAAFCATKVGVTGTRKKKEPERLRYDKKGQGPDKDKPPIDRSLLIYYLIIDLLPRRSARGQWMKSTRQFVLRMRRKFFQFLSNSITTFPRFRIPQLFFLQVRSCPVDSSGRKWNFPGFLPCWFARIIES